MSPLSTCACGCALFPSFFVAAFACVCVRAVLPALLLRTEMLCCGWSSIFRDASCAPNLVFVRQATPLTAPATTVQQPFLVAPRGVTCASRLNSWLLAKLGLSACWSRVIAHVLLIVGCIILTSYLNSSSALTRLIGAAVVCCACLYMTISGVRLVSVLRQHIWVLRRFVHRPRAHCPQPEGSVCIFATTIRGLQISERSCT